MEVHWVYSSCNDAAAAPPASGQGLDACVCPGGQVLRVRAQVFRVVEGVSRISLATPPPTTSLVTYAGSTTGTKYDASTCSEVPVNWEVASDCRPLSIGTLGMWCESNAFGEEHGHGARPVVDNEAWLSPLVAE